MSKKRDSKNYKRKDSKKIEEAYRLLEKIYREINEGKYKRKHLSNDLEGYKGKMPHNFFETLRKPQPYARITDPRYNQLSKASSQAGGRFWTEPTVCKPPERLVYDPDVKRLLEKIEAHLRNGLRTENKQDIEKIDVDELLSKLQKNYDGKAHERLLEKLLEEINEAEPKPELEDAEPINNKENLSEEPKVEKENIYIDEQEVEEKQCNKEYEKTKEREADGEVEDMIMRANEAAIAIQEHSDEILERMLGGEEAGERMKEEFMAEKENDSKQVESNDAEAVNENVEKETKTEEQLETSESESENVEVEEVEENCETKEKAEADGEPTEPQTDMEAVEDESEFSSDEIPAEPLQEVEAPVEDEAIDTEPSCD